MGKGDRRSRRGKLYRGSHGKRLPHRLKRLKKPAAPAGAGPRAEPRSKPPAS
jgi:ribosomal small subunit protein bTHX